MLINTFFHLKWPVNGVGVDIYLNNNNNNGNLWGANPVAQSTEQM